MDNKKIDILRKRNVELAQQVQELQSKFDEAQAEVDSADYKFIKELMDDFNEVVASLRKKEQEYDELISELKDTIKFMNTVEFRDYWVKKAKKSFLEENKKDL